MFSKKYIAYYCTVKVGKEEILKMKMGKTDIWEK